MSQNRHYPSPALLHSAHRAAWIACALLLFVALAGWRIAQADEETPGDGPTDGPTDTLADSQIFLPLVFNLDGSPAPTPFPTITPTGEPGGTLPGATVSPTSVPVITPTMVITTTPMPGTPMPGTPMPGTPMPGTPMPTMSPTVMPSAMPTGMPTGVPTMTPTPASTEPSVFFVTPSEGELVSNPVEIEMGAENFVIEGAGQVVSGAGHFHLMINVPCVSPGETIPRDEQHLHFGNGDTAASLDLDPGTYRLCLQAGDGLHTALDLTDEITITVEGTPRGEVRVFFIEPRAGATLDNPVTLKMGVENFVIEAAGQVVNRAGHYHILIDVPCIEAGQTIPRDEQRLHMGVGQTEFELDDLPAGEHSICLQLGNGFHRALEHTAEITFTVME